jgi:hypothetical protein
MDKNAPKVKAHFESLKKVGLDLRGVAGWEGVVQKYGEYENLLEKVIAEHPKAEEVANNPNLTPGPKFKEFVDLQTSALAAKQELKAPVEKLWAARAKLQDSFKAIADKKKAELFKAEFMKGNAVVNVMGTVIKEQNRYLTPVNPKPRALTGTGTGRPLPATPKPGGNKGATEEIYANDPKYSKTK